MIYSSSAAAVQVVSRAYAPKAVTVVVIPKPVEPTLAEVCPLQLEPDDEGKVIKGVERIVPIKKQLEALCSPADPYPNP